MELYSGGTLTFMLTDLEGSTRLWEIDPTAMSTVLARHDELGREAVSRNLGTVVESGREGDSFLAVFRQAPHALRAAADLQTSVASESWPEGMVPRIRIGVHAGEAELRGGHYYGQTLYRLARIMDAGHGGQVLVSETAGSLAGEPGSDLALRKLGTFRLRDLSEPVAIYQLIHPDLPTEFPPLRTLDQLPNNLPMQVTSFVGREEEIAELEQIIQSTRLVTLTGAGGSGKTRLAIQTAAQLLDSYPDGVWLADLAPIRDPSLVPDAVSAALGLVEDKDTVGGAGATAALIEHLRSKTALVILDNCEHVITEAAALAEAILRASEQTRLIATSREPLGVQGETTLRVPSLTTPERGSLDEASRSDAVRLFIDRAAQIEQGFTLDADNAPWISQIVDRLDGMPLAIELAAARVSVLSPMEIAERLDDRFRLLTGGARTAMERQQTLRAAVDWSYQLLDDHEKILLVRLSVFSGSFRLEDAERICAAEPLRPEDVLDLMGRLVRKSLILKETTAGSTSFRMLETIRQFAREIMTSRDDAADLLLAHRDHYRDLSAEAEPLLGSSQGRWLDLLDLEHDNLRAALEWSLSNPDERRAAIEMAADLARFWRLRGYWSEGRRWLERALESADNEDAVLARAMRRAGVLAEAQDDYAIAEEHLQRSLAISRKLNDDIGIAKSLHVLGVIAFGEDRFPEASVLLEAAIQTATRSGDLRTACESTRYLAAISMLAGDRTAARKHLEGLLGVSQHVDDIETKITATWARSQIASWDGDRDALADLMREMVGLARGLGNPSRLARALTALAEYEHSSNRLRDGEEHAREAQNLMRSLGDLRGLAWAHAVLGSILTTAGRPDEAMASLRRSAEISDSISDRSGEAIAQVLAGRALISKGEFDRAIESLNAGTATMEAVGITQGAVSGKLLIAEGLVMKGSVDEGEDLALDLIGSGDPKTEVIAKRVLARAAAARGETQDAIRGLTEAAAYFLENGAEPELAETLLHLSDQWVQRDPKHAAALYAAGISGWQEAETSPPPVIAELCSSLERALTEAIGAEALEEIVRSEPGRDRARLVEL